MQFDNTRPIWLQLTEHLELQIVRGEWAPGERIPSVRDLALNLGVNPNTVQRALTELDRKGLTVPERTAGRFTTRDQTVIDQSRLQLAREAVRSFISQSTALGLTRQEAKRLLEATWKESDDTN